MNIPLLLAIVGVTLQVFDFVTTRRGIARGGVEVNPILAPLMARIGLLPALWLAKIIGTLTFVALYWLHDSPELVISLLPLTIGTLCKALLLILVIFYGAIVYNNHRIAQR